MYAVVQLGSSQYKISEGDTIQADLVDHDAGKSFTLDKVLLFTDGKEVQIGQPYLKNVKVTAKVVGTTLGEKLIAHKSRSRTANYWKKGHRRQLSTLNITKITAKE
jgi:large subunit ribosomal protein L21